MQQPIDINWIKSKLDEIKFSLKPVINHDAFWNEFINTLEIDSINQNQIVLNTKNSFGKQSLNSDFLKPLTNAFNNVLNGNFDVVVKLKSDLSPSIPNTPVIPSTQHPNINRNYTFDNFVVSEFNKTAYAAAQSIFKDSYFNPIFISGGVGLGKTHLLYAIGNEFIKLFPDKKAMYVATDQFIREVYDCFNLGGDAIENIKNKYSNYDLLLIDDVQFLAKKEKMNEIFFTIFNNNVSSGKIIVLTSDKPPSYLENFEPRMKSRFGSGLSVRVGMPDLLTMTTILESKIKILGRGFTFTKDAIQYIVRRNHTDVRQLEGYLHQVLFYVVNNLPPNAVVNVDIIQKYIDGEGLDKWKEKGYDVDPDLVIEQIARAYNIDPNLILSKVRTKSITRARNVCMHALRNKFDLSFESIGSWFGRHHTTVMEAVEKIDKEIKRNDDFKIYLSRLYKNI